MTKKIALYLHTIYNGGVERVFSTLARSFITYGHSVDIVVNRFNYSPMRDEFPQQCRFINLSCRGYLDRIFRLTAYLKREKPAALLSAGHFANEVAVLAGKRAKINTRIVASEHTNNTLELRTMPFWHPRRIFLPIAARFLYPKADGVVAVSNGVKVDIERLFRLKHGHCTTIYNPVDITRVRSLAVRSTDLPAFSNNVPYIIAIGRLEVQKNYPVLLKAFQIVRNTTTCKLLILGVGSLKSSIREEIVRLGLERDVVMPGFIKNPYPLLKHATCFVLSSNYEGFGIVLVEALALETPVVSTDCDSGPREILKGGDYGTLVPVGDVDALASGILDVLDGRRRPPSWEEATSSFTVDHVVNTYLKILQL